MRSERELSGEERATYAWQLDVPGFDEAGQAKLLASTALVTRVGGLGGPLAFQLAAAGFGRIILAHGGDLVEADLNRQVLMARGNLGSSRVECAAETLRRFKPEIAVEAVPANVSEANAAELVDRADIVFGCAPLFQERLLLNRECVRRRIPLVDCAMYNLEGQITTVIPGQTACLACLYPEIPPHWKRRFPVFGAVSALVAAAGALEGIKLVAGFGQSHAGQLMHFDTDALKVTPVQVRRDPGCAVCRS